MQSNLPNGARLESRKEILARIGRGNTWLWARLKTDPTFPRPVYLSPREPQFFQHEIDDWLSKLAENRAKVAQEAAHAPA